MYCSKNVHSRCYIQKQDEQTATNMHALRFPPREKEETHRDASCGWTESVRCCRPSLPALELCFVTGFTVFRVEDHAYVHTYVASSTLVLYRPIYTFAPPPCMYVPFQIARVLKKSKSQKQTQRELIASTLRTSTKRWKYLLWFGMSRQQQQPVPAYYLQQSYYMYVAASPSPACS